MIIPYISCKIIIIIQYTYNTSIKYTLLTATEAPVKATEARAREESLPNIILSNEVGEDLIIFLNNSV